MMEFFGLVAFFVLLFHEPTRNRIDRALKELLDPDRKDE